MQSISSLSSLDGPSEAWMSVMTLYYRKKNKKLRPQGHKAALCNNPLPIVFNYRIKISI